MRPSDPARPSLRLALGALLGAFVLIPLWDVYALLLIVRERRQWPARERRRLLLLAAAAGLAWLGLGPLSRAIAQPGPLGVLATGLARLPVLSAVQPCCRLSVAVAPGQPTGSLLAARLPVTLGLLLVAAASGGVLTALLLAARGALRALAMQRPRLGAAAGVLAWLASSVLAVPAGALALLGVLVLGVRLRLFSPAASDPSALELVLAGLAVAMLPALLAARDAGRAGGAAPARRLILTAARAFFLQAGWLLSSLVAVEALFGLPGVGALLVEGFRLADGPAIIRSVQVIALLMLALRLHAALTAAVLPLLAGGGEGAAPPAAPPRRPPYTRLALAGLVVAGSLAIAVVWSPLRAAPPDAAAVYLRPSAARPLGTDHLGRDVRGRVSDAVLGGWSAALAAGLAGTAFGGLWAGGAALLQARRRPAGDLLAGLLLLPAEAATLAHPVLVVLLLRLAADPAAAGEPPALWLGAATGLALAPRAALALGEGHGQFPHSVAAVIGVTTFAALHYTQVAGLVASLSMPASALGVSALARPGELIASAQLVTGGPYLRLALSLAAPGAIMAVGAYLLLDAALDALSARREGTTARLLS